MASRQRRRGARARFFYPVEKRDRRGNPVLEPHGAYHDSRVSESHDRSSRAEVPGQQSIDMISLRVAPHVSASLWTLCRFRGQWWDVYAPPARRNGRRVQHLTVLLRRRPGDFGTEGMPVED